MAQPNLHVVEPLAVAPAGAKPIDPDRRLRTLFRAEARLERQMLEVRQSIQAERKRYSEKHKLGFFPAIEHLRRLFA